MSSESSESSEIRGNKGIMEFWDNQVQMSDDSALLKLIKFSIFAKLTISAHHKLHSCYKI